MSVTIAEKIGIAQIRCACLLFTQWLEQLGVASLGGDAGAYMTSGA